MRRRRRKGRRGRRRRRRRGKGRRGRTVSVCYMHFSPEPPFSRLRLCGKVPCGFLPAVQVGDFSGGERRFRRWAVGGDGERCGGSAGGRVQVQALEGGELAARCGHKAGREPAEEEP